jgi:hypothetical protein
MQTKQLETLLRMILAAALVGPALGACGGQVSDGTGQTSSNAGRAGETGFAGSSVGGAGAGAGGSAAGSGGATAGAGGAIAGSGGFTAGSGGVVSGGSGGAIAGAGGLAQGGAGGDPSQDFHALSCNDVLKGLAQELGFESIEIWRGTSDFSGGGTATGWMKVASDGVACNTPEKSTCGDDLLAAATNPSVTGLSTSTGGGTLPGYERVIATKGGLVTTANDKGALLTMFGNKVDTDAKLLLWLRYSFGLGAPCDLLVRYVGDHFEVQAAVLISDCPYTTEQQTFAVNANGSIVVLVHGAKSSGGACAGRRPEGLAPTASSGSDRTGQHFAAMAHLEAASVEAFARLTGELSLLGAPAGLLAGCELARQDEIRHAEAMTHLAARFGAAVAPVSVTPARARSAAAIAEENAIEGCVRETFGALVAHFQASQSRDGEVRAALARIAEDETRHAALSWQIQGWLEQERGCGGVLARVREGAVAGLRAEIEAGVMEGGEMAGLPDRETARRLLAGLEASLLA